METYQRYKGYGISYSTLTGNTRVDYLGFTLQVFTRLGEMDGNAKAKQFIDKL